MTVLPRPTEKTGIQNSLGLISEIGKNESIQKRIKKIDSIRNNLYCMAAQELRNISENNDNNNSLLMIGKKQIKNATKKKPKLEFSKNNNKDENLGFAKCKNNDKETQELSLRMRKVMFNKRFGNKIDFYNALENEKFKTNEKKNKLISGIGGLCNSPKIQSFRENQLRFKQLNQKDNKSMRTMKVDLSGFGTELPTLEDNKKKISVTIGKLFNILRNKHTQQRNYF